MENNIEIDEYVMWSFKRGEGWVVEAELKQGERSLYVAYVNII